MRKIAAVITATLGGLVAPPGAQAMLPADGGGAPPPDRDADAPDGPAAETPAKPVKRDPAPPPQSRPVRQERPVPREQPVREQQEQPVRQQREQPARREAPVRREPQERTPDVEPIRQEQPQRPAPEEPAARPPSTTPSPQPPADQPDRPPATPRADREQLRSDAQRYANALDQIEADDGALRMGTAQGMQLGDDPRVVRRAKQIREDEAAALEAQQERRLQHDRKVAEDARVLRESRSYMNAVDQVESNGGALNMGLSRALQYGQDPKVEAFVTEFERQMAQRREDAREQEDRAAVRRKAESYLNTLDEIERRDGALSMGLSNNLKLGQGPEVEKVADRMAARREAAEERQRVLDRARTYLDRDSGGPAPEDPAVRQAVREIEQRRQTRSDAERYAGALDQIDRNGGALNMGLARTLQEFADDNRVRRLAEQMRLERANEYKEEMFGPLDGPALRDPTLGLALPFPGEGESVGLTLEQKCMLQKTPNAALACAQGPKKPPVSVELTSKLSGEVSRGNPELAPNGETYETLSLSVDLRSGVKGNAKLPRGLGITLDHYDGSKLTYKLRVTSERADQIADGVVRPPNPIDPNSLRTGESITMDKEAYEGNSQTGSYYALAGTLGFEDGRRLSSAVERLENGKMRILVGDEEFVRHVLELRLGTEDFGVAAGISKEFAYGDLRTVDVNPDREPGWNAYQHFVTTGQLPTTEGPGVRDATAVEKASWSSSTTLKVDAKVLNFGGTSTPFAGEVTETRHTDGSVDYAMTDRQGSVTYIEQATKELGEDYGPSEYSLLLQGVDSNFAEAMTELHGSDAEALDGDSENLRLRFSESDLERIRQDAIEQISHYTNQADDDEGMTPAEVEQEAKNGYYDAQFQWDIPGGQHTTYLTGLATARHPGEVLTFLQSSSYGNSTALIDELFRFQSLPVNEEGRLEPETGSPPGSVEVYPD